VRITKASTKAGRLGRTQRKRQSILEAATDLFLRNGYPGTSMDEVARQADVSKQTVYAQFASKEALFVAMTGAMTSAAAAQVNNEVGVAPHDGKEVAGYLRAYAERQLMVVLTPRLMQLRRLVIGEVGRFPQLGRAVYEGGPVRAISVIASALEILADRGLLVIDDPVIAASHFNWLVMGDPVNRVTLLGDDAIPSRAAIRRHAANAVRAFLEGYGARS
jgi:TetR/AcrR family transcriptional regulator, mexJK operon transcriptional repressor